MQSDMSPNAARDIAPLARPLTGSDHDYDPLMRLVGDAHFVLIGDASHGAHECYAERARITQQLILEKGFNAIAIEADWRAAYRIDRYLHDVGRDDTSWHALMSMDCFPNWMWRNTETLDFIRWLHAYNQLQPSRATQVGVYGMDMYCMFPALMAANVYIDPDDPAALVQMLQGETQAVQMDRERGAWLDRLVAERERFAATSYMGYDGRMVDDEEFYAQQGLQAAQSARDYYGALLAGFVQSWNARDRHMADMLRALERHLSRHATAARIAVWEHNIHVGDARATDLSQQGEWSLGQIMRERYGGEVVLVGLSAYSGAITCSSGWNMPPEQKPLPPALPGSYEALFHETGIPQFYLPLWQKNAHLADLHTPHLERAIGVVYRPEVSPEQGYYAARLADQFDAVLFFDETHATEPLPVSIHHQAGVV